MLNIKGKTDRKYLQWLSELPCMFCNIEPCGEPHHVRIGTDGGMGMKPSDDNAIPTCHNCHNEIHTKGERTFYEKHGFTIENIHDTAMYAHATYLLNKKF